MAYKFTYRKEGNEYVFYRDEESVLLEDGIALATVNEDLAAEILKALEKQEHPGDAETDKTGSRSYRCDHYSIWNNPG